MFVKMGSSSPIFGMKIKNTVFETTTQLLLSTLGAFLGQQGCPHHWESLPDLAFETKPGNRKRTKKNKLYHLWA